MPKRTYQPKTKKRRRTHGWMARMNRKSGRVGSVIKSRRSKGRQRLAVSPASPK